MSLKNPSPRGRDLARESWPRLKSILQNALEQDPDTWPDFLREACGEDRELLAEAASLLEASPATEDFIERPAWHTLTERGRKG